MTEDERLDEMVEAQQEGDAQKAAALADKGHGYPPHVVEAAVVPEEEAREAEQQEAAEAAEDQPDQNERPPSGLMDDMTVQLLRLRNGEWILGQFKVVVDPEGNSVMAYNKVFRFGVAPSQQGTLQPQVSPWPSLAGTIELDELSATGFFHHGWEGMNIEDVYKQIVSPVAIAGRRQMAEELAKKKRAESILNAGKRPGNGPRR